MRKVAIRFPIVIYPSEASDIGRFTAHCLNMDVIADDDTVEGAVANLLETIEVQLDAAEEHSAYSLQRAPERYFRMLEDAQELAPELHDRITRNANKRLGAREAAIDVAAQCDLRQFQVACA